jgi:hypothetical protein
VGEANFIATWSNAELSKQWYQNGPSQKVAILNAVVRKIRDPTVMQHMTVCCENANSGNGTLSDTGMLHDCEQLQENVEPQHSFIHSFIHIPWIFTRLQNHMDIEIVN